MTVEFIQLNPIIPNVEGLNPKQLLSAYKAALRTTRFFIKNDFKATTRTWKRQPLFIDDSEIEDGNVIRTRVYTTDTVYSMVNNGTFDHIVQAPGLGFMVVRSSVRKTTPGHIGSSMGFRGAGFPRRGPWWVGGIVARRFDRAIQAKHQSTLEKRVVVEINARLNR